MESFDLLAPVLQEFIYSQGWDELRGIQEKAIVSILTTDDNLLLAAGTASGKTEAAFLPVLTSIIKKPSSSCAVLYVSPLKALINDQFLRLNRMLKDAKLAVTAWHGDASQTGKRNAVKSPSGIIQITPESLENMITRKQNDARRVFADLRFIIIDEVHAFMGGSRGVQLLCLLERLARLTNVNARRIGLSATVGDMDAAKAWLSGGTGRATYAPEAEDKKRRVRISLERYEIRDAKNESNEPNMPAESPSFDERLPDELTEELYRLTLGRKSLVFARSRGRIEQVMAELKRIAAERGSPDVYRVHHGSVSKSLREDTEYRMKSTDEPIVTGATLTLELGIDIGALDQVVHIGPPLTASSLTQRLGRCGRKGQPSFLSFLTWEHWDSVREHMPPSIFLMDWQLLRTVAITNLALGIPSDPHKPQAKWVEPPEPPVLPYAILAHQAMAHVMQNNEVAPSALARAMLTLTPFRSITQEDFRLILRSLLDKNMLTLTEEGGLIIGLGADRLVSSFKFSSVFEEAESYSVTVNGQSVGTVTDAPQPGMLIALAGMVLRCVRVNETAKEIVAEQAEGIGNARWSGGSGFDTHDRVIARMRDELDSGEIYPYLGGGAAKRLAKMRADARKLRVTRGGVIAVERNVYAWFPWVGTRKLRTIRLVLNNFGISARFLPNEFDSAFVLLYYSGTRSELIDILCKVCDETVDLQSLALFEEHAVEMKYNDLIPQELLHKQYRIDALSSDLSGCAPDGDN
ncbi:MAG: DEAD/DEAH box helicase [Oscillospiraceae bacterium]|nr:DEAD/DEAH box helicase [Oscillospiraceae bacterium]